MSTEAQVPGPGEVFLDHVGWYVPDLEVAARQFERLGFLLTPYTEHRNAAADGGTVASGTANRCAMLERGYLEILTAVPSVDSVLAHQLRAGLKRYQGVHVLAFAGADAEVERTRLLEAGFDAQPVVHLRRPVAREDGSTGIAAFSVVRTPPERMPEGRIQFLTQETPELVWQSRFIARDNAVEALTGVLLVVADVAEVAHRHALFTGRRSQAIRHGGAIITLDRGRVAFASAEPSWSSPGSTPASRPCTAAVALRSGDLKATRDYLLRQGVRLVADSADRLIVHPGDAAGAALIIHTGGAEEALYAR